MASSKKTVAQWLDTWQADYLKGVKPSTVSSYQATIKNHIKPNIGAIRLDALTTHDIQEFYNKRFEGDENRTPFQPRPSRTSMAFFIRHFSRLCLTITFVPIPRTLAFYRE